MPKLQEFAVKRVMSSDEATEVVGESVPDLEPVPRHRRAVAKRILPNPLPVLDCRFQV